MTDEISEARGIAPTKDDGIVARTSCPACAAPAGVGCYTPINGHDTGWTHDARVFKDMGVRA